MMHSYARREMAELSDEEAGLCAWLYQRCDDGYLSQGTEMWFWWTVYCDLMDYCERAAGEGDSR